MEILQFTLHRACEAELHWVSSSGTHTGNMALGEKDTGNVPLLFLLPSWTSQWKFLSKDKKDLQSYSASNALSFLLPFGSTALCLDVSSLQGHGRTWSHSHGIVVLAPINAIFETMDLSFITNKKGL